MFDVFGQILRTAHLPTGGFNQPTFVDKSDIPASDADFIEDGMVDQSDKVSIVTSATVPLRHDDQFFAPKRFDIVSKRNRASSFDVRYSRDGCFDVMGKDIFSADNYYVF